MNGLKKASLMRLNMFATIDKEMIIGKLGWLEKRYYDMLNKNLMRILRIE